MIDFLSLILSHTLMGVAALIVFNKIELNEEPTAYGRRMKPVGPRA